MLKRALFATLAIVCLVFALILVPIAGAQDGGDSSGMDAAAGTPQPLPTMGPRPAPVNAARSEDGGTVMQVYFNMLAQGSVGLARVYGVNPAGSPVNGVTATFTGDVISFFPAQVEGMEASFFGLIAASMEQTARPGYDLVATVTYADGSTAVLTLPIQIAVGPFIRQIVTLPPDTAYLLDPEIERNELARLESVFAGYTTQRYWDSSGFQMPIPNALTSPFGAFRTFNEIFNTRHTGWDIRTTNGQPVMAVAAGRVAFAGRLEIRGNHVIIDHGYGVYSTYSHLSQIYVTTGQMVEKNQVIGLTGSTGRTSGPHFHWEMAVNGDFVDSVQFIEMWTP
ncbi:MAG: M23 family metallopeptidase [Anaerolineae bacterium]